MARTKTRFLWNIGQPHIADHRFFGAQHQLQSQQRLAVRQATQTDQHNGGMGEDIAQAPVHSGLSRYQGSAFPLRCFEAESLSSQVVRQPLRRHALFQHNGEGGAVGEIIETLFTQGFLVTPHLTQHARRISPQAQAGGNDQKSQDGQEPPGAVDRIQSQIPESGKPERAELLQIIAVRFVLLEHRAYGRGDGDDGQQADGKAHRGQQFQHCTPSGVH